MLLALPLSGVRAQQRKIDKANAETAAWRYELQNEAVGVENTALVQVWSYSKDVNVARRQAVKNALHGLIFKGAPGNNDATKRTKSLSPLVDSPEAEAKYADFLDAFFADGGDYARYATITNDSGAGSVVKMGKEYKVACYVTVQYAELRRLLEEKGIVKGLAAAVSGKKPTIMVVPSDLWCIQNGYCNTVDDQGTERKEIDYERALQSDANLLLVISKIGELMADRGFPLKDLESSLKRLRNEEAEEMLSASKDTGAELAETPLERLNRVAKADIWMQVTWSINRVGPKVSITFNLQGKDAYTDKQIAASSGTCPAAFAGRIEVPVYLAEHVDANLNAFNEQLLEHFSDIERNGREVTLLCRCWSDAGYDFEEDFDGDELGMIIEDWVADHTVKGSYTTSDASDNRLYFEQVRIPLIDERGREQDARRWASTLRRDLKDKYGLDAKLSMKGLGQAILTLGGK